MHVAFFNPQGNFDPLDSHLTEHPDFGGQLVYVKELGRAMAEAGHQVDILTRQIDDPAWPEFSSAVEHYPDAPQSLRILRLPCGGPKFLEKERLWPHLDEFVERAVDFYGRRRPDFATAHYADGGLCAAQFQSRTGIGFTFTGHSLGAQKIDKLGVTLANTTDMEARFHFSRRIAAERLAMERASCIITSTEQERREQYAHPLYAGSAPLEAQDRFAVIPPGVNLEIFSDRPTDLDRSLASGLLAPVVASTVPLVVLSNRLDQKKNTIGVVNAFAASRALRERAGLVLCVRGVNDPFAQIDQVDPAERDVLAAILDAIVAAGLRERVLFLNVPSQRALAATYRAVAATSGVFALTAFYEPFGLAPIEAAACGLACVATCNGGPSEIFADGSGVLVDPADPIDIARGLLDAIDRQPELARQARERVRSHYSWGATAARYLEVITEAKGRAAAATTPVPVLDASGLITAHISRED